MQGGQREYVQTSGPMNYAGAYFKNQNKCNTFSKYIKKVQTQPWSDWLADASKGEYIALVPGHLKYVVL